MRYLRLCCDLSSYELSYDDVKCDCECIIEMYECLWVINITGHCVLKVLINVKHSCSCLSYVEKL